MITPDKIQRRLLWLAGGFLASYALALSLSPAARTRSLVWDLRWDHWLGFIVWASGAFLADRQSRRYLPERDPYLLPVALLLSGWGLMTIWRLSPEFGLRQTIWLGLSLAVFNLLIRVVDLPGLIRNYKYLLLTGGLLLMGLTLLLGTNPTTGSNPRLWLGCCGIYFQPSEPLKLLLIIYLAAYFADHPGGMPRQRKAEDSAANPLDLRRRASNLRELLSELMPTLIMTGLTLLLLLAQRDLGTSIIFIFLYATIAYLATGREWLALTSILLVILGGVIGYALFDVVRLRIDAWLNPWIDPSGRSYQIVQSVLALANGGVAGRGPGMGSPGLVPVAHSDFIFAALVEEGGLFLAIGLVGVLGLITARSLRVALQARDAYHRFLAAGLTAYLAGQTILIVGGNLRLLPLTGVTLPFISYGGSSLLTAYLSLSILLLISQSAGKGLNWIPNPRAYIHLGALLFAGLGAVGLATGWWTVWRGPALLQRTDNARRAIADRYVARGDILDRKSRPLVITQGEVGSYERVYLFPEMGAVIGYNHPVYGQSGLEADLDNYLRGLKGNPELSIWWHHVLYGQPPPGRDVRLSIDSDLQQVLDQLLHEKRGGAVLLNAASGEVLTMASHPAFDANRLEVTWSELITDPNTPLINRAIQGRYQVGAALGPFLLAAASARGSLPPEPETLAFKTDDLNQDCALAVTELSWSQAVAAGCPGAVFQLGGSLGKDDLTSLIADLGFLETPDLGSVTGTVNLAAFSENWQDVLAGRVDFRISPLQMALAAASLTAGGQRPSPQLSLAVNNAQTGWTMLSPSGKATRVFSPAAAETAVNLLGQPELLIWASTAQTPDGTTWFIGGTLPAWSGSPLALVVFLEQEDAYLALEVGQAVLRAALQSE